MNHMTVSADLKARVTAKIAECIKMSGVNIAMPTIKYDINSARLGGTANHSKNLIRVNPVFLNAYADHYIDQTCTHEAAHLIARAKYGRMISSHGPEWKQVMRDLGVQPDRCHNYKVPEGLKVGKNVAKHACVCERCGYEYHVGTKVANKISEGASYRHRGCGGKIVLPMKLSGKMVSVPTKTAKAYTVVHRDIPVLTGTTKLAKCSQLFVSNPHVSRQDMLALFVSKAGCTPAGASSYYSKLMRS